MRTHFLKLKKNKLLFTSAVYCQPEYSEGFVLVITLGEAGLFLRTAPYTKMLFLQKSNLWNESFPSVAPIM